MGIDIDTYRCRVGAFVPHRGAGVMFIPLYINFSVLIKYIGTVSFVRLLLIIAGIEPNPGPADKLIFRYQYLLIKLGTDVLRKLFDVVVGNDVVKYIIAKSQDIQKLIIAKVITADQQKFLPPIDNQPDSSNFDITLLCCLLRNICGLRQARDPVWMNPQQNDTSIEADITRLRTCRNQLMHTNSLFLSETEFEANWKHLSTILNRLNNVGRFAQLQSQIDEAKNMVTDEELKITLDETAQAWTESDRLFDHGIGEVMSQVANVEHLVCGVHRQLENMALSSQNTASQHVNLIDIQTDIVKLYQRRCRALPVSPLFENKDENFLNIYKYPSMFCSKREEKDQIKIKCLYNIFNKCCQLCNEIYITGDAGVGKTSFCTFVCLLWSVGKNKDKLDEEHEYLEADVDYLCTRFNFVFYLSLRETEYCNVIDMIQEHYLHHYDKLDIQNILRTNSCLILMDGLDEWTPRQDSKKQCKIPERIYSDNCVYLTTSRPYKVESERLSYKCDMDQLIEMTGMQGDSKVSYIKDVVRYMNKENSCNRTADDFTHEVKQCGLDDQLCIPMITSHLVVLWFEKKLTDMPKTLIYANIIDMLFKRAEQRKVLFPSPSTFTSASCELQLIEMFPGLEYLTKHFTLLYNICQLSFRTLFFPQDGNVSSLIFTKQQLQKEPFCVSIEEIDFLCKVGILSQNEMLGCFSVQRLKLCFIHKSYMEFFAALFVSFFDKNDSFSASARRWTRLDEVLSFKNVFQFLAGCSYQKISFLFDNLYLWISEDLASRRKHCVMNRSSNGYEFGFRLLQNLVANCYKEVSRSNTRNTRITLKLEDFIDLTFTRDTYVGRLLILNISCIKSLHVLDALDYNQIGEINSLQYLYSSVLSDDCFKFMLKNKSTLQGVCLESRLQKRHVDLIQDCTSKWGRSVLSKYYFEFMFQYKDSIFKRTSCVNPVPDSTICTRAFGPLIPDIPWRSFQHLTSFALISVGMQHKTFHNLQCYLSEASHLNNIAVANVCCSKHLCGNDNCRLTLNLSNHKCLTSLFLNSVNIICNSVNTSSLKSLSLQTEMDYSNLFECIKHSRIEYLCIYGCWPMGMEPRALIPTVKTLAYIKSLKLGYFEEYGMNKLQMHPDITQVDITLQSIVMTGLSIASFIGNLLNSNCIGMVKLRQIYDYAEPSLFHSPYDLIKFNIFPVMNLSDILATIDGVNLTKKGDKTVQFQTSAGLLIVKLLAIDYT